jgi:hypothetical protein
MFEMIIDTRLFNINIRIKNAFTKTKFKVNFFTPKKVTPLIHYRNFLLT